MAAKKEKLQSTEENLAFCLETHHYYSTTAFPRICHTCEKIYMDRGQFLKETASLPQGTYSKGTKGKVFEYRNCQCGSTLVCAIESQRDNSPEGLAMRKEFDRKLKFLTDNGIETNRAREIVLAKIRRKKDEAKNPDEEAKAD